MQSGELRTTLFRSLPIFFCYLLVYSLLQNSSRQKLLAPGTILWPTPCNFALLCGVSDATHNFGLKQKRYRHLDQRTASAMSFRGRITRAVPLRLPRKVPTPRLHRHQRSDGILPPSQEVTAALLGKRPQEPPRLDVDYEKPASLPSHLRVSEGEVMKAIQKFPLGSAAGGSGLRPNHIYELSKVQDFGHRSTFISAMTRFLNLFLSGKGPPQLAPWLCGAPLTALQKRNGGIRPIAVGETLRRLISSCAMNHISKKPLRIGFILCSLVSRQETERKQWYMQYAR